MIRGTVVGQDGVIIGLQQVPPRVLGLLRAAVRAETLNLVREAKLKVSGPVLKTKTGTLRRGINAAFEETDTAITGSAGIGKAAAKYPAVHEFGGTFTIREHVRRVTKVFGRPVKTIRQVTVREHSATYPERSYLRSTLWENYERILRALEAAVKAGLRG